VQADIAREEKCGGPVVARARHRRGEADRDRGRVGARLVDEDDAKPGVTLRLGQAWARAGARGELREILCDLLVEAFGKRAGDADGDAILAEYTRSLGLHVVERDRRETCRRTDGRVPVRMILVDHRVERLLAERLVVRAFELVFERALRA